MAHLNPVTAKNLPDPIVGQKALDQLEFEALLSDADTVTDIARNANRAICAIDITNGSVSAAFLEGFGTPGPVISEIAVQTTWKRRAGRFKIRIIGFFSGFGDGTTVRRKISVVRRVCANAYCQFVCLITHRHDVQPAHIARVLAQRDRLPDRTAFAQTNKQGGLEARYKVSVVQDLWVLRWWANQRGGSHGADSANISAALARIAPPCSTRANLACARMPPTFQPGTVVPKRRNRRPRVRFSA